jgi:hypothetical protein
MRILVSDTSVLIDLERGAFPDSCFDLPFEFAVPDLLYARELVAFGGPALVARGLRVEASGLEWDAQPFEAHMLRGSGNASDALIGVSARRRGLNKHGRSNYSPSQIGSRQPKVSDRPRGKCLSQRDRECLSAPRERPQTPEELAPACPLTKYHSVRETV